MNLSELEWTRVDELDLHLYLSYFPLSKWELRSLLKNPSVAAWQLCDLWDLSSNVLTSELPFLTFSVTTTKDTILNLMHHMACLICRRQKRHCRLTHFNRSLKTTNYATIKLSVLSKTLDFIHSLSSWLSQDRLYHSPRVRQHVELITATEKTGSTSSKRKKTNFLLMFAKQNVSFGTCGEVTAGAMQRSGGTHKTDNVFKIRNTRVCRNSNKTSKSFSCHVY